MSETNQAVTLHGSNQNSVSLFSDAAAFEQGQRMARLLSSSDLVPTQYRETGNMKGIANTLIALNVAQRMNSDPIMVMQNLNIIHGRPSWSSSFIIAAMNSCGRFSPLEFVVEGQGDELGCYVTTRHLTLNKQIKGPRVTIAIAKKEGWFGKAGSKWPVMPEVMLQYRAASFFGRLHAPDILMGMSTDVEAEDAIIIEPSTPGAPTKDNLNERFAATATIVEEPTKPQRRRAAAPPSDPMNDDDGLI